MINCISDFQVIEPTFDTKEHICEGIENFYDTFLRLFSGEKLGKLVLKIAEDA